MNTMAIALGMHVRVGIEDTLFGPHGERMTSVQQIEMVVRQARELRREVATGAEARSIFGIGQSWGADDSLARLGMPPNRGRASAACRCASRPEPSHSNHRRNMTDHTSGPRAAPWLIAGPRHAGARLHPLHGRRPFHRRPSPACHCAGGWHLRHGRTHWSPRG